MDDGYYDLGTYSRPITTSSADAQLWFDRGLIWTYGYNHEEAIVCFETALEHDPQCAMAHWGIAYAVGPELQQGVGQVRSRGPAEFAQARRRLYRSRPGVVAQGLAG